MIFIMLSYLAMYSMIESLIRPAAFISGAPALPGRIDCSMRFWPVLFATIPACLLWLVLFRRVAILYYALDSIPSPYGAKKCDWNKFVLWRPGTIKRWLDWGQRSGLSLIWIRL